MRVAADPESERSLDLRLFDDATDLMCVRDMQGRFVRVNKAWEFTLGLSIDEVQNTPLLPLIHPADVPATLLHMAQADQCRQVVDFVNRYRRRDGHYRYIQWRAQRLGDVILGRARDITAHRRREEELRSARQALDETLADIGSHVRLPADELLRTVEALGRTELTPDQHAMVQRLGRSVQTIEELVSRLVEREREAAWASFRPSIERHRLTSTYRHDVHAEREHARLGPRRGSDAAPPAVADPSLVLQRWVLEMAQHVDDNPVFHRAFRDLPSQTLGLLAIRLDRSGRFYPRRLQSHSARYGLMSAGRAAALLARMQDIGFVTVAGQFQAGQIRPHRVQAAMTRAFAETLVVHLRSLAARDYRAALAMEAIEVDEARATPLLAGYAEALLNDLRSEKGGLGGRLNGVPLMARGQAIALSIGADAVRRHGAGWEGWIEIALTTYARRFDVSRVHVRRVIESLEPCGLLRDPASPSRLLVTSRFREEIEAYRRASCDLLGGVLEQSI